MSSFEKVAIHVTLISIWGNLILSAFKLFAGIKSHSDAMISDAIHSASDVFSSFVIIIGVKLSTKASDKEHPYGHERFECVAAILLSIVLLLTGLGIGFGAGKTIITNRYISRELPGTLALVAAIVSIICKEAMFRYTKYYALYFDSSALMADAWHHRSDALSSIGAFIGIFGANHGLPILDPLASLIICFFIVKAGIDIFSDAVKKMVDHASDDATEKNIYEFILKQEGVLAIDSLLTRIFGNKINVDVEICADSHLSLKDAHEMAQTIHDSIQEQFPKVKYITILVNPYTKSSM